MKLSKLYIENFICYSSAYIDFTEFSSALIVGKKENNDMYSNGVGKTTIFKAIEYVLFNQSDNPLERLIRDDTDMCRVVLDFYIDDQEYRLSRSRTKKGSSDLTLLQRNSKTGSLNEVYHSDGEVPFVSKKQIEKHWKDLSGSRAGDTEKDVAKLIKINHKSFVSTAFFPQNDMSGLPTATPEKRKGILKEALNLLVYTKLEKIAKDKSNALIKEIDKTQILIDNLGDPGKDILDLTTQLSVAEQMLFDKNQELLTFSEQYQLLDNKINDLKNTHSNLESNFASLVLKEASVCSEKNKIELSIKEYQGKKSIANKSAREIIDEIASLKKQKEQLVLIDYDAAFSLNEKSLLIKENIAYHNASIKSCLEKSEELKIPVPNDAVCKHCRQAMTDAHRDECKNQVAKDLSSYQDSIQKSKKMVAELSSEDAANQKSINDILLSKKQLDDISNKIISKNKEVQDKKELFNEYNSLLVKFGAELELKDAELVSIKNDLSKSSMDDAKNLKIKIEAEKQKLAVIASKINQINKEITHYNSNKAVIQHTIDQRTKDKTNKSNLDKLLLDLDAKLKLYPSVIRAFSSTGIPNLIIQNVLDDLQIETNNLLEQLKPGLQLSFFIEKTRADGEQADTLDINYHINGKERYYKQLSGAMQLAVSFSLKLGLSFLLQKMIGTDIKFLLLDEVDQSLDKSSVDAFADIVKFFQKDFTILIITHNDRLKDKFAHSILVEQDINMISTAKVVST